jgi:UTP:GlnB (protein PII) uridylyltransferase
MDKFLEGMRRILKARAQTQPKITTGVELILNTMDERQRKFHQTKQEVEDNIKKGAILSDHKISL